jgi:hypothetical protein
MSGENPVMILEKVPIPAPSVDNASLTVGFDEVLQHTPLEVMLDPPSSEILPPETAVVAVISETTVVKIVIIPLSVVNPISLPYLVPTLLEAYALT